MENLNNPFTTKNEDPIVEEVAVETPEVDAPADAPVEEPTPEPVKVEEAPKAEETKPESTAIKTTDFGRSSVEVQGVTPVANGAIGVGPVIKETKKAAAKKVEKPETVAIHSTKNVTWEGVGKVYRGYNIVTKEASEKWLTRSHIRIATPEEVAKEFGK
jgi:hypothetical protein